MFKPLKLATPLAAFAVSVPPRVAPAVPVAALITNVTAPLNPVAVLPKASRASITGWVRNAAPAWALLGEVVKASWVAAPAMILKVVLSPEAVLLIAPLAATS